MEDREKTTFDDLADDNLYEIGKTLSLRDNENFSSVSKNVRGVMNNWIKDRGSHVPLKWRSGYVFLKYKKALEEIAKHPAAAALNGRAIEDIFPPIDANAWEFDPEVSPGIFKRRTKAQWRTMDDKPLGRSFMSYESDRYNKSKLTNTINLTHKPDWTVLMRDPGSKNYENEFYKVVSVTLFCCTDGFSHFKMDLKNLDTEWNNLTMLNKPMKWIIQIYLLHLIASFYNSVYYNLHQNPKNKQILTMTGMYDLLLFNLDAFSDKIVKKCNRTYKPVIENDERIKQFNDHVLKDVDKCNTVWGEILLKNYIDRYISGDDTIIHKIEIWDRKRIVNALEDLDLDFSQDINVFFNIPALQLARGVDRVMKDNISVAELEEIQNFYKRNEARQRWIKLLKN